MSFVQNKNIILISVISMIILSGFLFTAYKLTNGPAPGKTFPAVNIVKPTDHLKWAKDSKNILVEYSDLQCPACKNFHNLIQQGIETTTIVNKVRFVYRHYPLTQIHQHATEAAYAAEAAGKQGKFFEYTNILFRDQAVWEKPGPATEYFLQAAGDLKLDLGQFRKDMSSKETKDKVDADVLSGDQANVNATPTFYLNGEKLDSIRSFEEFKQILQALK
ncbi:thioredoxin domain-containing protein [Candidatus Roizmanbacteria bacterium]|nr:thioredoxin domain-containing protein [Candidatus Roizmanbacteria bacterium]